MMQCPKCHAPMQTYNRNGVQIEQCSGCRGIFLDYGELEALTRLESPVGPAGPAPAAGAPQAYPQAARRPTPRPGAPRSTAGTTAGTTAATAATTRLRPHALLRPERRTGSHERSPRPSRRPGVLGGARYWD